MTGSVLGKKNLASFDDANGFFLLNEIMGCFEAKKNNFYEFSPSVGNF